MFSPLIDIQPILLDDLRTIEIIGRLSLPISYAVPHLLGMLDDPAYLMYKAVVNQSVLNAPPKPKTVGFVIAGKMPDEHRVHIMSLAVLQKYRRQGAGMALVNKVKADPEARQITLYVQEKNFPAIKFYAKQGFKSIERLENYYQSLNQSAYFLRYLSE